MRLNTRARPTKRAGSTTWGAARQGPHFPALGSPGSSVRTRGPNCPKKPPRGQWGGHRARTVPAALAPQPELAGPPHLCEEATAAAPGQQESPEQQGPELLLAQRPAMDPACDVHPGALQGLRL